ncbi:hypothetical protein OAE58_01290 [Akkermansiaceae bacterium]|nr:hypothetical protein [Akkermansiaceae bacterium]MDA7611572.1 hypothetical protein [bacterium]MDA7519027.1 hypothetical protein [Akkermansiaceae bacterium]MDA7862448.1 hypothetical protein [Akkermansiaceae bacterium]MDA7863661.1 hypothetical protein [Akkermansiaceae bacterium]
MASPKTLAEPHKEIRFTRSGQAQGFFIAGAVAVALALLLTVTWVMGHPSFHWWMPLPALVISFLLMRVGIRCSRHAYLIFTPMGVEVFPFFKPDKNLNLIYWNEIEDFEIHEKKETLTLHRDAKKTTGVIISLKPILAQQRDLLEKVLEGRLAD